MDVRQALGRAAPRALTFAHRDVPHAVLEPNLSCNLTCRACYRTRRNVVKSLAEIEHEIDQLLAKRRLETLSILGGEPTLHPELPRIVALVKRRGLTCQLLTNGVRLEHDHDDALLDALVATGLDRIILHVDRGQEREGDPDAIIAALFARFERRRLNAGLAVTVYPDSAGTLGDTMLRFARFRCFDGILATLHRDTWAAARGEPAPATAPSLDAEHRALAAKLGITPSSYLPSSLDPTRASWLIYFYFLDARSGRAFALSPRVDRLLRRSLRLLYGRYVFGAPIAPDAYLRTLAGVGALECALGPRRAAELGRFVRDLDRRELRVQYIVVQSGPEYRPEHRAVQLCHHCPDATLREGKLVPVCLADVISPLAPDKLEHAALRQAVHDHLGEAP